MPLNSRSTWRGLMIAAALVAVLLTGLVHGLWTRRWSGGEELTRAKRQLENISSDYGPWQGQNLALQESRLEVAEIVGYVRRLYTSRDSGAKASVLLMCGPPGPLSIHTPEHCYTGAGYEMIGTPLPYSLSLDDGTTAELFTARFHKPRSPSTKPLRIFWTWMADDGWQAPSLPRWTFRRAPALYKLYTIREMDTIDEFLPDDPLLPFLRESLPRMRRELSSDVVKRDVNEE